MGTEKGEGGRGRRVFERRKMSWRELLRASEKSKTHNGLSATCRPEFSRAQSPRRCSLCGGDWDLGRRRRWGRGPAGTALAQGPRPRTASRVRRPGRTVIENFMLPAVRDPTPEIYARFTDRGTMSLSRPQRVQRGQCASVELCCRVWTVARLCGARCKSTGSRVLPLST